MSDKPGKSENKNFRVSFHRGSVQFARELNQQQRNTEVAESKRLIRWAHTMAQFYRCRAKKVLICIAMCETNQAVKRERQLMMPCMHHR